MVVTSTTAHGCPRPPPARDPRTSETTAGRARLRADGDGAPDAATNPAGGQGASRPGPPLHAPCLNLLHCRPRRESRCGTIIAQSWREPVPIGGRPFSFSLARSRAMMVVRRVPGGGRGDCCGEVGCGNSAQAFAATGAGGAHHGSSFAGCPRLLAGPPGLMARSRFGSLSLWSHSLRPDCGSYVSWPYHGVQFSVSADRSTVSLFFVSWCSRKLEVPCA